MDLQHLPKEAETCLPQAADLKKCLRGYSSTNKSGLRGSSLIQYHSYSQNLFLDQSHQPGRAADTSYSLNPVWTPTWRMLVGKALWQALQTEKRSQAHGQLCLVSKGVPKAVESRRRKWSCMQRDVHGVLDHNTRQKETHGGNRTVIKGRGFYLKFVCFRSIVLSWCLQATRF